MRLFYIENRKLNESSRIIGCIAHNSKDYEPYTSSEESTNGFQLFLSTMKEHFYLRLSIENGLTDLFYRS